MTIIVVLALTGVLETLRSSHLINPAAAISNPYACSRRNNAPLREANLCEGGDADYGLHRGHG